jgi:hypothetical protein
MKYIQWSGLANRGLNVFVNTNYHKLTLEKVTDKLLSEILFGDGHRAIISDWIKGDLPPPVSEMFELRTSVFLFEGCR